MKRPLIICLATALLSAGANAAPQTLTFTFAPLQCTSWNNIVPGGGVGQVNDCGLGSLSGDFTFNDGNNDGHIVLSELLRLNVGGISAPGLDPLGHLQRVNAFDYSPASGLSFSASDGWRTSITTGVSYQYVAPGGGNRLAWMPSTSTTIPAVPEPATGWTLLAGAALFGWRIRRRPGRAAAGAG